MIKFTLFLFFIVGILSFQSCKTESSRLKEISPETLKDKIAGGWAGKMIGVTYGAPTEFRALNKTYDDSIKWTAKDIRGSMWQDDIYVQLTFMMTMDQYGMNAPAKKFQEMFAKSGYPLWHANVQARKNYYDSIFPPASGSPEFNSHADDIDFQIEADYLGFMCPGMPQTASKMADKIGHIMNYGDGVYGGIFLGALYSEAFFESDIPKLVDNALKAIPAESDYSKIISDVIKLHTHFPQDWKKAWKELNGKWTKDHYCEAGSDFNIDAKLNGAFIVMGLLFGDGDPQKTLEIATRCGQDSDCNPSNAMAVLGVIKGFRNLPEDMKNGVKQQGDSLFINTDYSFNKAVDNTYKYALQIIKENGGTVGETAINILTQTPISPALEVAFPNMVLDVKVSIFESESWKFKGSWQDYSTSVWREKEPRKQAKFTDKTGDEIEFTFNGTGVVVNGNWFKDAGKADVYLDGKFHRTIDSYFFYNKQEHGNIALWHALNLPKGVHKVKFVVKADKNPASFGHKLYICQALVFKTETKKSVGYKFSFEK